MNRLLLLLTFVLATLLPAAAQRTVSICMVGDIMPGTTYPDSTTLAFLSRTPEKLFEKASHIFKGADLTIGNFESSLVDIGDATPRKKGRGQQLYFPYTYEIRRHHEKSRYRCAYFGQQPPV